MNPATEPPPPPAVALPLQPPRSSFSCERHPDENFTGFCPSCLCERLTTLDQSAGAPSSSRRNSTSSSAATAAAAIKSIFKPPSSQTTRNSFFPELRRTKSFSAAKNDLLPIPACVYEPQRKSCDVRGRNTLSSLFTIHDENKPRNSYSQQNGVVLETNREIDEEENSDDEEEDEEVQFDQNDVVEDEIRVSEEINNVIVEEEADVIEEQIDVIVDELKPMKDHLHIDLDSSNSKKSNRSNFWSAASVLGKKWQKWRRKQKKSDVTTNGNGNGVLLSSLPVEKPISRQFRETQSEIADYGFGRRSCDTDPRFSLDAGRISFDDPRYSFDEPRASWDGYLIGRTFPRLPPMVEDDLPPVVQIARCDSQIPVENVVQDVVQNGLNVDENVPGGSIQTREYYLDSSSKRRKSLDRSNSIRKMANAVVAELEETKVNTNKVSPTTYELPRVSNSNSLRDDCSETFELGFRDRDNVIPIEKKENKEIKKPRRWRWKLWGFVNRRNKDEDEDRCSSVSGVGRSYSESWQDLRTNGNHNEVNGGIGINRNVFRSNSSVSWRSSSLRKSNHNMNGFGNGKNRNRDEFVLERNRSARYSPNHIDNGLLRFYLAPLSGSRRGGIGIATGKSRTSSNSSHSIARSMLGLY